jgi:hypothetical protein
MRLQSLAAVTGASQTRFHVDPHGCRAPNASHSAYTGEL